MQKSLERCCLVIQEEGKYQSAANIIDSLLTLDASIDGEEEIERRVAILREFDLENDLLLEMQSTSIPALKMQDIGQCEMIGWI